MSGAQTLVRKREYARMKGRNPNAVSQWIEDGRLTPEAIVHGKVWVEKADEDLARNLAPGQQAYNPAPIVPLNETQSNFNRRAKTIADKAEQDAIAAARKNAVEAGQWINAEEAAKAWQQELQNIITETETFLLTTVAKDIANDFNLDWKLVSLKIRACFREHRTRLATIAERELSEAS